MKIEKVTDSPKKETQSGKESGNAILMLFAMVGMAGVLTYGLNNVIRGPAMTTAEVSKRTIAENNLIASTRLAISGAVNPATNGGDCDGDGFIEPVAYRDAGVLPKPVGGGLLPMTLGASLTDPWGVQYGYCVWDPGTATVSDNIVACGGNTAKRLEGAPRDDQYALAVISAGKNGAFETDCNAFIDITPADGIPDTTMLDKGAGSDDIVLAYSYAEANGVGGGEWKLKELDATTAEISKNIEVGGGGQFSGKLELKNKGMVLPGDPGDDTITGACTAAKDQQIRRNTSSTPPSLEMCDFANSAAWVEISGGAGGAPFNPTVPNCTQTEDGPLFARSTDTSVIIDQDGFSDGNFVYAATPTQGLRAYAKTNMGLTYLASLSTVADVNSVWSDGNFVYTADATNGYSAHRFNGSAFTTLSTNSPGQSATTIWGDGHYLYGVLANNEWYAKFNGTSFLALTGGTHYPKIGTQNIWANGTYLYMLENNSGTHIANVYSGRNGTAIDQKSTFTVGASPTAITGDGTYIYVSNSTGIHAYSPYNGVTGGTLLGSYTANGASKGVWSDGAHIYAITSNTLHVLDFDGTTFTHIESITPGTTIGSVFGDGDYIYTIGSGGSGGLIAYSGYACISNQPHGWTEGYNDSDSDDIITDPLDVSMISHWKLDDASGTTATDSIDDNNGAFVNTPTWAVGIRGSRALSFSKADRDAVQITGLLDQPHQGTIALWVNANSFDTSGYSHFVSLGNDIVVGAGPNGPFLEYNNGGGTNSLVGHVDINGTGWHYLVVTFDDVSNNSDSIADYTIYLDGMLLNSAEYAQDITYSGGADTWIGRHGNADATYDFDGGIDDVRVYSRALGPSEVKKLSERMKNISVAGTLAPISPGIDAARGTITSAATSGCAIKQDGRLGCWGDDTADNLGNGASTTQQVSPVSVSESNTVDYYFDTSFSDINPGGASWYNKMVPGDAGYGFSGYLYSPGQVRTGYYYTNPAYPGIDDGVGPQTYSATLSHSAQSCISTAMHIARVDAAGAVQVEAQLGSATVMGPSTLDTFTGSVDLGTFGITDRIRLRLVMTETCGSSTNMDINYDGTSKLSTPISAGYNKWLAVTAGTSHTCGIRSDSTTWCWGSATVGKLGNSLATTTKTIPHPVALTDVYGDNLSFSKISAGANHTCGIKTHGKLYCWGEGTDGKLGSGGTSTVYYPQWPVINGAGAFTDWFEISGGTNGSCGIRGDGIAYCWGDDTNGQNGNGAATAADQTSPSLLDASGSWVRISRGTNHACGIKADGSAWCWGSDSNGQLGNRVDDTADKVSPVHVEGLDNWVDISAGDTHTCGLRADMSAWCWGNYLNGRLGIGTTAADALVPTRVAGNGWATIEAGTTQTCAMKQDDSAWCWGSDSNGQLGNGAALTADQFSPSIVSGQQKLPGWGWNDAATIIMAPYGTIALNDSFLSDVAGAKQGFGFTSAGTATLRQLTTGNQLLLETQTAGASAQTTFNTYTSGSDAAPSARWLFDETSGTTAAAANGGLPGTLINGPTWWPTGGKVLGALSFDASLNQYVQVANNNANIRPANIALSVWIKRNGAQANNAYIINKAYDAEVGPVYGSYGLHFKGDSDSILSFETYTSNGYQTMDAVTPIPDGVWTHVQLVYGNGSGGSKAIWINGVRDVSIPAPGGAGVPFIHKTTTPDGDLFIGQRGCATPCNVFNGALDDLRIRATLGATLYTFLNTPVPRTIGYDAGSSLLEIGRNNTTGTNPLSAISPDFAIDSTGNVGIGTSTPAAKVDVNGGVRIGYETNCGAGREGAIRFTGATPPYEYCNGTSWTGFDGSANTPWKEVILSSADGGATTCGLQSDGKAYCWGENNMVYCKIGDNCTPGDKAIPTLVHTDSSSAGWSDWIDISTGTANNCGIRANSTAWCWGNNAWGVLGINDNTATVYPRPVQVHSDSSSTGWTDWVSIEAGNHNNCGLRSNGTVWCWGHATSGKLGNNDDTTVRTRPVQVHSNSSSTGWTDWVQISGGSDVYCGIRANGTLWCWGNAHYGVLGNNQDTVNALRPVQVHSDSSSTGWTDWKSVSVGYGASYAHACGIRSNGTAWCWGKGHPGSLGNNQNSVDSWRPIQVHSDSSSTGWTDWVSISSGSLSTCGIRVNGTAWCWGSNGGYGLGNNSTTDAWRPIQVHSDSSATGWTDWTTIVPDDYSTCGTRSNGTAWCWGANNHGQLGHSISATRPQQVTSP